jgi:hypothetical protein
VAGFESAILLAKDALSLFRQGAMSTPPPAPQLVVTIDARTHQVEVSLRLANGTQSPPQRLAVSLDGRLGAFVAAALAARTQLAPLEAATIPRTADGNPTVPVQAGNGEQRRQG